MSSLKLPLLLISVVLLLDIFTKFLTHQYLPQMNHHYWYPYGGIAVIRNFFGIEFSISYATNKGAAWGVFSHYQFLLLLLRMALIGGLMGYFLLRQRGLLQQSCLALILAGAIGNVIDYFIYGHVVDMLHFVFFSYDFPVFNLADTAIFLGVCGYFLTTYREKQIA
ncbi:Lipoprotein signal peptidase [Chlamydiales bacterium STE3]|nr:Lipoprotein signal peptidase [Chlamydiales bacterium STE3]